MKKYVGCAGLVLALISGWVSSDTMKPEDSVEYRQSAFRLMSYQLNVLNPLHRSKAYSDEQFVYRSEMLNRLAALALEGFTEESKSITSRSAPAVWDNHAEFTERMQDFIATTAELTESARAGQDEQTRDLFRQTLQSCRACHDRYRLE
ncbi:c-type cytochrome [Nitrincola iocasae]|uniref:Cytochrome c n=1 Tax=Nitrincola iocasae TaxID=2614693 RepID=A0A5J6LH63_9GAMM|nr:cytochrome c [Nitrincola iocasae]QEW07723.1 cytochrome c [Nitrincola iocasae]